MVEHKEKGCGPAEAGKFEHIPIIFRKRNAPESIDWPLACKTNCSQMIKWTLLEEFVTDQNVKWSLVPKFFRQKVVLDDFSTYIENIFYQTFLWCDQGK